jgi:hypothetical protein
VSLSILRNRLKLTKLIAVLYKIGVPAPFILNGKAPCHKLGHSRLHEEHTSWHVYMFKGANHHGKVVYNQSKGKLPPWLFLSCHIFCLFIYIYLYFIYLYFIFTYLYTYLLLLILISPRGWYCLSSWWGGATKGSFMALNSIVSLTSTPCKWTPDPCVWDPSSFLHISPRSSNT